MTNRAGKRERKARRVHHRYLVEMLGEERNDAAQPESRKLGRKKYERFSAWAAKSGHGLLVRALYPAHGMRDGLTGGR